MFVRCQGFLRLCLDSLSHKSSVWQQGTKLSLCLRARIQLLVLASPAWVTALVLGGSVWLENHLSACHGRA